MQVTVLRDGGVKDISIFDLLVGDVMLFETGDILAADAIIIITGNTIRLTPPFSVETYVIGIVLRADDVTLHLQSALCVQ